MFDFPEDTDIQGKIVKTYYNSAKRPRVKEATQECNKIERELNYCKQFLHLKNWCNDKIIGMHQYYTEVKTDNTSSSLISLRFTHLNEQMLGIWPRSGFQAKKTSGCGDQWLSAVFFASCRRCGGWERWETLPQIPSQLLPFPPPLFSSISQPWVPLLKPSLGWGRMGSCGDVPAGDLGLGLGLHSQRGRVITQPALLGLAWLPGGEKLQGELQRQNRLKIRFGVSRRRSGWACFIG